MVANAMVNRTKAFTGGRDGHDSNNWFFKESLYDEFGPMSDDKYEVETILRKNMHKLAENAVIPVTFSKGDVEIQKVQLNNEFAASLITGKGNKLFQTSKGVQTFQ